MENLIFQIIFKEFFGKLNRLVDVQSSIGDLRRIDDEDITKRSFDRRNIWASTFFVQVPLHEKLGGGFDADVQKRLVSTNWIRTIFWTLRGALVLWMVWLKIK